MVKGVRRRSTTVDFEELAHVLDDDLAVDELEAVERRHRAQRVGDVEELALDGVVDSLFDLDGALQEIVEHRGCDALAPEALVEVLRGLVEDVAEDAVVDEFVVVIVGFLQFADVAVEEPQLWG